jgi:anti-sigma regulatory factor (Ser/Thr protein kinase)
VQSTISLRAPNIGHAGDLAVSFVDSVARLARVGDADADAIRRATAQLVEFALEHSYPPGTDGEIAVDAHLFDGGIRVDVHDWGLPLDLQRHRATGAPHESSPLDVPGLDLLGVVDEVSFQNLGRDGKLFSIVKHCAHDSPVAASAPLLSEHDDHEDATHPDASDVLVRPFAPGDEQGICQLVYRNVGQHALLRVEAGPLAETGAAVVHPDRKGLGVFNSMSLQTLARARETGLSAVYAQNVSIHPYSQKAAYTHGYRTTAIAVGRARASIRLEGNRLTPTPASGTRSSSRTCRSTARRGRSTCRPSTASGSCRRTSTSACRLSPRRRTGPARRSPQSPTQASTSARSRSGAGRAETTATSSGRSTTCSRSTAT